MMEHFAIDLLSEYKLEALHDTERVINPAWRQLQRQRNSAEGKLRHRRARFGEWTLHTIAASEPKKYQKREHKKAELHEEIQQLEAAVEATKAALKETARYIAWKDLPEQEQFLRPVLARKRLIDAVRMIAYRTETAMCALWGPFGGDISEARRLLQDLFLTEANIRPDATAGRLYVDVHRGSRPAVDRDLSRLFSQLNQMQFTFPGTQLVLHYRLLGENVAFPSATPPPGQDSVNSASQE